MLNWWLPGCITCLVFIFAVKLILKSSSSVCPLSAGMVALTTLNILATTKMDVIATQHKLITSLASDVMNLVESHQLYNEVRIQKLERVK